MRSVVQLMYKRHAHCFDEVGQCICHSHAKKTTIVNLPLMKQFAADPNVQHFGSYAMCITRLEFDVGHLVDDFDKQIWDMLGRLPNVESFTCPFLPSLAGIGKFPHLKWVKVHNGNYSEIPEEFYNLKDSLVSLDISGSPVESLPDFITEFVELTRLSVGKTLIRKLPEGIGQLRKLTWLSMKTTIVAELPASFQNLTVSLYLIPVIFCSLYIYKIYEVSCQKNLKSEIDLTHEKY